MDTSKAAVGRALRKIAPPKRAPSRKRGPFRVRTFGPILAAAIALSACEGVPQQSVTNGSLIDGPIDPKSNVWAAIPTGSQLAAVYPAAGRENHIGGTALLQCHVTKAGDMAACIILSEEPAGLHFGAAAFSLTRFFRLKPANYGPDATVIIPLKFNVYG